MQSVRQKLHSQRGASVVMALMFFLICLMVGGVMLTAASANAGRLSHLRKNEQAYLSLSSAARLLRDDFEEIQYRHEVETVTQNDNPISTTTSSGFLGGPPHLSGALKALVDYAYDFPGLPPSQVVTISFAGTEVKATLNMTPKGNDPAAPQTGAFSLDVIVALMPDEDAAIRLYIPASVTTSKDTVRAGNIATTKTLTTITWGRGEILRVTDAGNGGGTP